MEQQKGQLFVLGGRDLEMEVIRHLLNLHGLRHVQPSTQWGDHAYTPADVGVRIVSWEGRTGGYPTGTYYGTKLGEEDVNVFFVECRPAEGWQDVPKEARTIDHHGARAGEPASILQVIEAAGLWPRLSGSTRRWVELVAGNDAGYIPAMLALGATPEEIQRVRALDRQAQGISPAHEAEAARAIDAREIEGRLTTVRMSHSKTATVADRLYGHYDQLLILSGDGEANFFGDGALCFELHKKFRGWSGGSGLGKAGESAFWGGYPNADEVLTFVNERLAC